MNELRWILIGFGIVLLAAIYLWGRRGSRTVASEDAVVRVRPEPALHLPPQTGGMQDPVVQSFDSPAEAAHELAPHATWRGRVEPTFAADAAPTEELPVRPEASAPAPTLSSSESPQPRRVERRKILSLRLSASPHQMEGAKLLEALQAESLEHGKYDVFHRLHQDGVSIFSVASMVEPGTFDLASMEQKHYPGVTLFAQLPGPTPGMHALNELIACARKLQQSLGGTLQDDRGVPLTVHRIERLRQEVREFERPASAGRSGAAHSFDSSTP